MTKTPPRGRDFDQAVADAHAAMHYTRCAAWLNATGYRPRKALTLFDHDTSSNPPAWMMDDVTAPQALRIPARPGPNPRADKCSDHPVTEATMSEAAAKWFVAHPETRTA